MSQQGTTWIPYFNMIRSVNNPTSEAEVAHPDRIPESFLQALLPNERILWIGRPSGRTCVLPRDWVALLACMFFLLAVFQVGGHHDFRLTDVTELAFWLVLFGALLIVTFGSFVFRRLNQHRTMYAVTNKRVIVSVNSWIERSLKSRDFDSDFSVSSFKGPKGTLHIFFGHTAGWLDFTTLSSFQPLAFRFLENGDQVLDLILTRLGKGTQRKRDETP